MLQVVQEFIKLPLAAPYAAVTITGAFTATGSFRDHQRFHRRINRW
jgi:hypothetical protein